MNSEAKKLVKSEVGRIHNFKDLCAPSYAPNKKNIYQNMDARIILSPCKTGLIVILTLFIYITQISSVDIVYIALVTERLGPYTNSDPIPTLTLDQLGHL